MTSMLQDQLPPTATNVVDMVDTTDEAFASVIVAADTELVNVLLEDFDYEHYMNTILSGVTVPS
jgi:hypothetical protein